MKNDKSNNLVISPIVGGIMKCVTWNGGSNNPAYTNTAPHNIQCFRPTDISSMQRQDTQLKEGVGDELKLDLLNKNRYGQTVYDWIDEVKNLIEINGMDTVFKIFHHGKEGYMLDNWREL